MISKLRLHARRKTGKQIRRLFTSACTPDRKDFDSLRSFIHAVIQAMLSSREKHTTDASKLSILWERPGFGIGGDELEDSSELFAK